MTNMEFLLGIGLIFALAIALIALARANYVCERLGDRAWKGETDRLNIRGWQTQEDLRLLADHLGVTIEEEPARKVVRKRSK